jgi:hypothetical protein
MVGCLLLNQFQQAPDDLFYRGSPKVDGKSQQVGDGQVLLLPAPPQGLDPERLDPQRDSGRLVSISSAACESFGSART